MDHCEICKKLTPEDNLLTVEDLMDYHDVCITCANKYAPEEIEKLLGIVIHNID